MASVSEAKNQLSALLDQVRRGFTIVITDRGVPIARLVPSVIANADPTSRLARLERAGLIRRGTGLRLRQIADPPPHLERPVDVLELLAEERADRR